MIESNRLIQWGPKLFTGIAVIDEQHRVLVDMCNDAHDLMQGHASTESTLKIVRDLMSYALYHFEMEEAIANKCGYAASAPFENDEHREQHRAFARAVAAMQLDMSHDKEISVDDLFAFLRSWLTNHILGVDMKLAKFILKNT